MHEYGEERPAAASVLRTAFAFVTSQALYVAAELGIADHMAGAARTAVDLALATQTHPEALLRLLQTLATLGIVEPDSQDRFTLTPAGELLRTDVPGSLRATIRFLAGPWAWRAFELLDHSVRTGEPAFDRAWGVSNFEYWARHPEVSTIHDEAMAGLTSMEAARVLGAYDVSPFQTIVDVGGGNGAFLAAILSAAPRARGIVADLPHVVAQAFRADIPADVRARCEFAGGDFFESVPAGGDLYILKHVVHDWDDRRAQAILANCRRAMHPTGRLLVVDCVLPDRPETENGLGYLVDMTMLVMTPGGRERTHNRLSSLLQSAGFTLTRVIPIGGIADAIEARPM